MTLWFACPAMLLTLAVACSGERKVPHAADAGAANPSLARHVGTVKGLQTPESARWDSEIGVWFVSNINGTATGKDDNGFISRLKFDGTMDSLKFVAGGRNGVTLHSPKGMAIVGDTVWIADIDAVRGFNRKTGAWVANINVPGAKILNDVVAGPDGLYITDTGVEFDAGGKLTHPGPDRVFRIAGRRVTTAITFQGKPGPNGITWDPASSRFLVVPFFDSTIVTWALGDTSASSFTRGLGMMDGIESLGGGRYLVTGVADSSLNIIEQDKVTRVAGGLPTPADIGFDRAVGRVAVPLVTENRVEFFELGATAQ